MLIALAAAVLVAQPAPVIVTPATIYATVANPAVFAVHLAPGAYPAMYWRGATARTKPITIDASDPAAISAGMRFDGSVGVDIEGLTLAGGSLTFNGGSGMIIHSILCTSSVRNCIGLGGVTNARISYVESLDAGSDGIDVGGSNHFDIGFVTCSGSHPTPGAHPDCVQIYSAAGAAPTTDGSLHDSVATGDTQGFNMFGSVVPGTARITFARLTVMARYSRGISLSPGDGCTACSLTDSRVLPMRGSKYIVQMDASPGAAMTAVSGNSVRPTPLAQ